MEIARRVQLKIFSDRKAVRFDKLPELQRGLFYKLLGERGDDLHSSQQVFNGSISYPFFNSPKRVRGQYGLGGEGLMFISCFEPEMESILANLGDKFRFGPALVEVDEVVEVTDLLDPYFRSSSPVVLRKEGKYVVSDNPDFNEVLLNSCNKKLLSLGLEPVEVDVMDVGKTRFFNNKGKVIGHKVIANIDGSDDSLSALRVCGLGGKTSSGFGHVL